MAAEIYYFSGTGNSLTVARDIAKGLQGKIISIGSTMNAERIRTDATVIGIVFPVHNIVNGGVPSIIRRFVAKLDGIASTYIFAVCTCGAGSGDALVNLAKIIKGNGGELAAGYTVKMPFNCPPFTKKDEQLKRFDDWNQMLPVICETVSAGYKNEIKTVNSIVKMVLNPVGAIMHSVILNNYRKLANAPTSDFDEAVRLVDRSYYVDDKCNGCGICVKVCPVKNIALIDMKPVWQHHCECCLACFVWCPPKAVFGGLLSGQEERYHHPDVKTKDMLEQR